jgi:5-oxoprolinase (ATP-hydrolysing) subunit A
MSDSEGTVRQRAVRSVDLNADLGEGFASDRDLLHRVTSASVCCGAHAGSPVSIRETLHNAQRLGVVVGAHPGYPDREGFGRRARIVTSEQVEQWILDQVAALGELAGATGVPLRFLKPHGALYNQAQREEHVARGVIEGVSRLGLPLLGQPGTILERLAAARGIHYVAEGFPDRRYQPDGTLVPRSEPGSVLRNVEEVESNVVALLADGRAKTLCIHGDDPDAVANADRVRLVLDRNGITPRSFLG